MKKKFFASALAISCAFSLAACSTDVESLLPSLAASETLEETTAFEEAVTEEETTASEETVVEETTATEETVAEESTGTEETVAEESTGTEETVTDEDTSAPSVNMPSELSDDIYSFQVSIDGTVYQFPMWYSDFEAMGWTFDEDATEKLTSNQYTFGRWKKDGFTATTRIANLSMNSAAYTDCIIGGITFDDYYFDECDWEIVLPKGIQYGVSTRDDIIAAYGDPSDEYDGDLYYNLTYDYDWYQTVDLYVYKETGTLDKIEIENMIELEGADNSIDPTVPEVVNNYVAPTELGDNLYVYNIELEGNLYHLPCPVSVLLENGFTINEQNSEMEIAADSYGWLELRYNNQTYRSIVQNYADYATIVENCFVTSWETSDYEPTFNLTIPGNIKLGDSEDAVKAAVANFNCEIDDSSEDWTYYNISDPNGSSLDGYTITVKEGIVTRIIVEHDQNPAESE